MLKSLKKSQIQKIATHFKLTFTTSTRKDKISWLVIQHLIDEALVSEHEIEELNPSVVDNNVVELKHLEPQDREREQEAKVKLCELELQEKELSLQLKLKELEKATAILP